MRDEERKESDLEVSILKSPKRTIKRIRSKIRILLPEITLNKSNNKAPNQDLLDVLNLKSSKISHKFERSSPDIRSSASRKTIFTKEIIGNDVIIQEVTSKKRKERAGSIKRGVGNHHGRKLMNYDPYFMNESNQIVTEVRSPFLIKKLTSSTVVKRAESPSLLGKSLNFKRFEVKLIRNMPRLPERDKI